MANKIIDITGMKFNMLTAISKSAKTKSGNITWKCICECGNTTVIEGSVLRRLTNNSCGCKRTPGTHNMSGTPTYKIWKAMRQRCSNPNDSGFPDYGGRGISVCSQWDNSFEVFYADMGNRPSNKHSIDRINNNGNYTPDNCKWSTDTEQANNRRSNNLITYNGVTKNITQWSLDLDIHRFTLFARIFRLGWSVEKAFTKPVQKRS